MAHESARPEREIRSEFLRGQIESIPLPSSTVDVIISNCVINLSGDKRAVLAEAFRVLRPGGKLLILDLRQHDLDGCGVAGHGWYSHSRPVIDGRGIERRHRDQRLLRRIRRR